MSDREPLNEIRRLCSELIGPERMAGHSISPTTRLFDELGLSSLEVVSLLNSLDSATGLRQPVARIAITELHTVADLLSQLPAYQSASQSAARAAAGAGTPRPDPVADSMHRGARRRRRR